MSPSPHRILHVRTGLSAMVALDTFDDLATRVENLLSHGRRIAMTRRYTYVNTAPELAAGLTLDGPPRRWHQNDGGKGLHVTLKPGIRALGFSAYPHDSATEAMVWARYHANKDDRRDMTRIDITGGLPGDGPARDDSLVIRWWNNSAVCTENVIAFDYGSVGPSVLASARQELTNHMANLSGCQPWEIRDLLQRLQSTLERLVFDEDHHHVITVNDYIGIRHPASVRCLFPGPHDHEALCVRSPENRQA